MKVLVNKLRDFLTPENISTIAKEVVDLCERENNNSNAKRLQKLIADNEKATENLLKALENGQAVDIIANRITQEEKEHDEHSLQLLLETSQHPVPSMEDIRFFLNQFRKGDINDPKYRHGLVEMLVNKIHLYDDKMTVLCNTQDGHFDVDLKDVSSLKGQLEDTYGDSGCIFTYEDGRLMRPNHASELFTSFIAQKTSATIDPSRPPPQLCQHCQRQRDPHVRYRQGTGP